MKIIVESMGLPTLSKLIGKKAEFDVNSATVTVADLVSHIVKHHGQNARKVLLDSKGKLDIAIQVMINDEGFLAREDYARRELGEADRVRFMLLVGGG